MSFAIFDENFYLANYPDVRAAVQARAFSSGLQHFQQYGLAEGRTRVSPFYIEQLYLLNYLDVANAVRSGAFKSGLQHYINYGEAEGRSPGLFNEQTYRQAYPDVAAAIAAGGFSSGLQHYILYGQAEGRFPFSGPPSLPLFVPSPITTIQGTAARDLFFISGASQNVTITGDSSYSLTQLGGTYVGGGNTDYVLIQNFEAGKDRIGLPGSLPNYSLQTVNGSLNISTSAGDLIAIVAGIPSLSPVTDISGISIAGLGVTTYLG